MIELDKELRGILGRRPVTADELSKAQKNRTLTLPGAWETNARIESSILEMILYGLPEDYFNTYAGKVRALSIDDVVHAAGVVVHPDQLAWLVVGDRAKIEPGIRELGWGEVQVLDADGNPAK